MTIRRIQLYPNVTASYCPSLENAVLLFGEITQGADVEVGDPIYWDYGGRWEQLARDSCELQELLAKKKEDSHHGLIFCACKFCADKDNAPFISSDTPRSRSCRTANITSDATRQVARHLLFGEHDSDAGGHE